MKKLFFLLFSISCFSFYSQSLSTSLTACYALNGNASEPINNLNGTLSAVTPTVDRFSNSNSALYFNGTGGSFISLPNSPLLKPTNAISFSAWVKFDNVIQNQYIVFAHNNCVNFPEGYALLAQNLGSGFKLHAVKSGAACSVVTRQVLAGTSTLVANTWYHIGGYIGNDSLKVYINGALESAAPTTIAFNYSSTDNVYLGGSGLPLNFPLNGSLDNARFYNRKLSGTEFSQLYLTDPICAVLASPNCNNSFYALIDNISTINVVQSSLGIPNTSTIIPILSPGIFTGLAIGSSFSFPAPNPTFWICGATYSYFDGTSYINTNHMDLPGSGQKKYGGSKNFIYSLDPLGQVFAYNGTGTSSLIATVPTSSNGIINSDIVGDDMDNFYILKLTIPQRLLVYNNSGTEICSYVVSGMPTSNGGDLAIVGNTVTAAIGGSTIAQYYVGTISGSSVNFTQTAQSFSIGPEFANCPRATPLFPSNITANPSSSISCNSQTVTLTASSTLTPGSYAWAGPGILTSTSNQTVQVNMPGVYTCTLTSCPMAASIASYTVLSGSPPINPTITATNSLSCTSPTAQLSVAPNSLTNTILWSGPGIVGANNTPTITINAGGNYTVVVTNTLAGCSGTQTINVASSLIPITITVSASNTQVCLPSAPITLTASGATTYNWAPIGSTIPTTGSVVISNPTITTTYTVTGFVGACSGSAAITVSVNSTPTLLISGNVTACSGAVTSLTASGASTYTWLPGNLSGSIVTVTPTSTTTYTIIGANGACTATTSFVLATIPIPTITASASPTIICQGSSSTLTATGALTYTWQPGSLNGNTVSVSPLITTIYTVTGTNLLGCTSSKTLQLVVNNPTVTVSPASTSICVGQSATLTANGATSYTWNPGSLNTSSIIVSPTVSTTYTLLSINGACSSTNTIPISVSPTPTILVSPVNSTICSGNSVTLTASGGTTYTWAPVSLTSSSIVASPTVNTTYTVTGVNAFGCSNTTTAAIVVNASPTLTAVSNPTFICSGSGSSATLTASGANTYTWNPGTLTGTSVIVSPVITTTYTVTGTNSVGCTNTQTASILVSPTPTLNITVSPTIICRGASAALTAIGAATFTWFPGNLNGASVVVSPTATTIYTVVGQTGNCTSSKTQTLVVLPRPTININIFPPVICTGTPALLIATGGVSYTWAPGSSNGNTLIVLPFVTTSYTVTGTNAAGCTNTAAVTLTVNPTPTVIVTATAYSMCIGSSVTINASGGLTYITNPGAQVGPSVIVSPTVTSTYSITGVSALGCTDTEQITIDVVANPVINATSSSTFLCEGQTFSLNASGANNYTWMPVGLTGNNVATTATSSILNYTLVGETDGCISSSVIPVTVINCHNTEFGITKAAGKPVLLYNSFYNVDFTITAVNASTTSLTGIVLNEDLGIAFPTPSNFTVVNQPVITSHNSNLTINPLFDGISQISLTSPAASILPANKRDTIVFTVRIDPKGYFGPFKNSVIGFANYINNVILSDSSNNGFNWDPDQDGDPTNNDTVTIINLPPFDLFIPDGFSPDGDGKNDVFFIKGINNRTMKLTVFNRWGNKVYEKSEYDNTWNGYANAGGSTIGNNKVPPSTYYYIIEFMDGDKETRTGYLVIQY